MKEAIEAKRIFITRADKGGATLIMNYSDVVSTVEKELSDRSKYELISDKPDEHRENVTKQVREVVKKAEKEGLITAADREIITGLTDKLNMKHHPEFRPEDPTIYPLFKLHKQSQEQINNKEVPPARFVNNSKYGPLYRLEKWMSRQLSKISSNCCKDEYLRDTDHLQSKIDAINEETRKIEPKNRPKYYLYTLDVAALYPSIRTEEARKAMVDAFNKDDTTNEETKSVLLQFTDLIFSKLYIKHKNSCYKPLFGIPTGGCNSRQVADMHLHRLLEIVKQDIPHWEKILLLLRFIDDIFGLWAGTI